MVLLAEAPRALAQRNPLRPSDFAVGSALGLDADSLSVLRQLGHPDSVRSAYEPWNAGVPFTSWYFRDVLVTFETPNVVEGILLTTRTFSTARGIRVGDSRAHVRRAYGPPVDGSSTDQWLYVENQRIPMRLIQIEFVGDHVSAILIRHSRA
jgi:hypothetical protein